jgi:hypothetical protein
MLSMQSAGVLVAGAPGSPEQTITVRLLRPICIAGERVEPQVLALPKHLATMLIGANKAERAAAVVAEVKPPEVKPAEVATEEQVTRQRGRPRKEDK